MYRVPVGNGEVIHLCLDCMAKHQHLTQQAEQSRRDQLEILMRAHNYYSYQMDMISGVSTPKYQIPQRAPVLRRNEVTLQNIKIDRSSIAVLNTGSIGSLDLAIGELGNAGESEAAKAFREITQAVASSDDLDTVRKNEVLDTLSIVAAEATVPEPQRRKASMRALLTDTATVLGGVGALAQLWQQFGPVILQLFR